MMFKLLRRDNPFPLDRTRDLFAEAWTCDSSQAERDFGFLPAVDLKEGIDETMQWYRKEGWI